MLRKKKTSADYGQFYFRVIKEEQAQIESEIQSVLDALKAKAGNHDLLPKRNELILRALRRGLKAIERELK
jgi:hypothetical protein